MKRIAIYIALLLFAQTVFAGGIEFFHGSWEEALAEAKSQKKLICVDVYTTWCGPCKAMARNTFTDDEVGEFFNENFVCYKLDAEKGEGPQLASKFGVRAYPTIIFVNYANEVVYSAVGYKDPQMFLEVGNEALNPEHNQKILELEYENGTEDPEILYEYAMELYEQEADFGEAADRFFATQKDKHLLSERGWKAIQALTTDINSREFQLLLDKQKKFEKIANEIVVEQKIFEVLKSAVIKAHYIKKESLFEEAVKMAEEKVDDDSKTANRLKLTWLYAQRDWKNYATIAMAYMKAYKILDPNELNHLALTFGKKVDNKAQLEEALNWSQQSIAIRATDEAYEAHAWLLYQTGDYYKARISAERALSFAEESSAEEDRLAELQKLVEMISEKMQ
jgi:thioredoxin-related protein